MPVQISLDQIICDCKYHVFMHLLTSTVTHPVFCLSNVFLDSIPVIQLIHCHWQTQKLLKLLKQVSSHLSVIAIVYNVCQYFNTYIHKSTIGEWTSENYRQIHITLDFHQDGSLISFLFLFDHKSLPCW